MTLENHKSFPVLLKIVNPSNLVLNVVFKAFSDNIELSFVKLRPRLKKKKNKLQALYTRFSSFILTYTLQYYHSNHVERSLGTLWSGMKYPK